MITRSGLVSFWIGAVLLATSGTATIGLAGAHVARMLVGGGDPWLVAAAVVVGSFVLCLLVLASRCLHWDEWTEVPARMGLIGTLLYALAEVAYAVGEKGASGWLWASFVAQYLGFLLVFNLGDYPPGDDGPTIDHGS